MSKNRISFQSTEDEELAFAETSPKVSPLVTSAITMTTGTITKDFDLKVKSRCTMCAKTANNDCSFHCCKSCCNQVPGRCRVADHNSGKPTIDAQLLNKLNRAILDNRCLTFNYLSGTRRGERRSLFITGWTNGTMQQFEAKEKEIDRSSSTYRVDRIWPHDVILKEKDEIDELSVDVEDKTDIISNPSAPAATLKPSSTSTSTNSGRSRKRKRLTQKNQKRYEDFVLDSAEEELFLVQMQNEEYDTTDGFVVDDSLPLEEEEIIPLESKPRKRQYSRLADKTPTESQSNPQDEATENEHNQK
jgi:hypothetical protein